MPIIPKPASFEIREVGAIWGSEFEEINFRVRLTRSRVTDQENPHVLTTHGMPDGASIADHNWEFSWTPTYNQAGNYVFDITVSRNGESDTIRVILQISNVERPFFVQQSLHVKPQPIPERGVVRYKFIPHFRNVGDVELNDMRMTFKLKDYRTIHGEEKTIPLWWVEYTGDEDFPFSEHFFVEFHSGYSRNISDHMMILEGTTPTGEEYLQEIPLQFGIGPVKNDFLGFNASAMLFKDLRTGGHYIYHDQLPELNLPQFEMRVTGDLVAKGDLDGDGREDLIFEDEQNGRLSFITWIPDLPFTPRPNTLSSDDLAWNHIIKGTGDFDGDGADEIVVIEERMNEIQIWPFNLDMIHRGWVSSIPIPAHYEFLKIGDLDGDRRADILWHDTRSNQFVLWKRGEGPESEERIGSYNPNLDELLFIADQDTDGVLDIATWEAARDIVWVFSYEDGEWEVMGHENQELTGWRFAGAADVFGYGIQTLFFRNEADPKTFKVFDVNFGLTTYWKIRNFALNDSWKMAQAIDFTGDGAEEMIWIKETKDEHGNVTGTQLQVRKKVGRWHVDALETVMETSIPVAYELITLE